MTESISPCCRVWVHHLPAQIPPSHTCAFIALMSAPSKQCALSRACMNIPRISGGDESFSPPPSFGTLNILEGKVYTQTLALPYHQPNCLVNGKSPFLVEVRTSQGCWQLRLGSSSIIQINDFLAKLGFHMLIQSSLMTGDSLISTLQPRGLATARKPKATSTWNQDQRPLATHGPYV